MSDYTKPSLRCHQMVLYELLKAIDEVCKKHDIHYMLFAGTALGAVRHHGFIPWDDDLDVVMLRSEYERFMKIAPLELDKEQYFLQIEHTKHWPMFFSKLRKNNTTCLERYIPRDQKMHQGIYIDIFPCDNLSDHLFVRKMQFLASKVVIAKSLNQRGYITHQKSKKIFIGLCRFLPEKIFSNFVKMQHKNDTEYVHTFFGGASSYEKNIYPRKWFVRAEYLQFEDGLYPVTAYYEQMLTKLYGNYMEPLPESQRGCKVHGELVDLNLSYEHYLDMQKQMTFDELTRSIR